MGNNLKTTTTEADARLHMRGYVQDGNLQPDMIVREWKHIDATYADTLISTMQAVATVTNPKVDNQGILPTDGVWTNGSVKGVAEPGEIRWVTIRQWLYLNNTTPTSTFKGESAAVGRRPATYTREWPNITQAQKNTLLGSNASPGIARLLFAYNDTVSSASTLAPEALTASNYSHLRCVVIQHPETGLCTVRQTGTIPKSGSGAADAEPFKVKIVGFANTTYRVTESRDYGLSEEAAADYVDAAATGTDTLTCPAGWGGKNAPVRNLGYTIKEQNGTTYTGVRIIWSVAGQTLIDPTNT